MINERLFWQEYANNYHCILTTETPHVKTTHLSQLAQTDLAQAMQIWHEINTDALAKCLQFEARARQLYNAVQTAWHSGGRVFIAGCGASGRLAVLLARLVCDDQQQAAVVGMIAGGDVALIRAVESFEDTDILAERQLQAYGFTDKDLLIGLSVNGEAQFIQHLVQYASMHSSHSPILISCNPAVQLLKRNKQHVIANTAVQFIDLTIGALALTGSTRLQTSDVILWVLGQVLLTDLQAYRHNTEVLIASWDNVQHAVAKTALDNIVREANYYANDEYVLYRTDSEYGLTVLSDTTERAPTFHLVPFENDSKSQLAQDIKPYSKCYVAIAGQQDRQQAWQRLLGRAPVCLNWPDFLKTSEDYFYGFDITEQVIATRARHVSKQHIFTISELFPVDAVAGRLAKHLILKMLLNRHSTLVMGRLGYYQGNLMTVLFPGNIKLVDRAARYVQYLYQQQQQQQQQQTISYRAAAQAVLACLPGLQPGESVVELALARLS